MTGLPSSIDNDTSNRHNKGSTIGGAAANLTNSIVGAGCIGLGGAMAQSGGGASLIVMGSVAYLTKLSLDLVIDLGIRLTTKTTLERRQQQQQHSTGFSNDRNEVNSHSHSPSFEAVGRAAMGNFGVAAVTFGKCFFSFGCIVAYIVIVKDNVAPALLSLTGSTTYFSNPNWIALLLATVVILPMCLPKDLSALENLSKLKIGAYGSIAAIVIWLYFQLQGTTDNNPGLVTTQTKTTSTSHHDNPFVAHWCVVHLHQLLPNTGTFVFAFLAQHVVNLVFVSLRPQDRNMTAFRRVSTLGVLGAAVLMLSVGLPVYLTFWEHASSDLFLLYPTSQARLVNVARLFLSTGVILTYPLPLFGLRDSLVQLLPIHTRTTSDYFATSPDERTSLLEENDNDFLEKQTAERTTSSSAWWLENVKPPDDVDGVVPAAPPTLIWPLHIGLTIIIWMASVVLALSAPSLGAVLNVVGCISGSLIAFLLPGLFWIRLVGWSALAVILCTAGTVVGCLGTYYSLLELQA